MLDSIRRWWGWEIESQPQDPRVVHWDRAHASRNAGNWPQGDTDVLFRIDGRGSHILSLVVFGGGRYIATLRRGDNKLQVWSTANSRLVEEMVPSIKHGKGVVINVIATSKDGRYVVSGDARGHAVIWDTTHPSAIVWEFEAAKGEITALDVSSDSWRVAIGSNDGTVVVWSIKSGKCLIGPLKDQDSPVKSVKFSPAGGRIASAYYLTGGDICSVRIWHSHTGVQLESIPITQSTWSLAWSADSQQLFIGGSGGSIKCFDIATRSLSPGFRVPSGNPITALCLTRNGRFLVSVSSGHVDIWDIQDICPDEPFRSHKFTVAYIERISADDICLISIGEKNEIAVRCLLVIIGKTYDFHHMYPSMRHSKPFTYINHLTYEAWKNGGLMKAEETLSKEIEDPRYRDTIQYICANRALVRVRREDWIGALEDINAITPSNGQIPLIASIAKALALKGKGDFDAAIGTFVSALRACDREVRYFVECVKNIAFVDLECPGLMHREIDIPSDPSEVDLLRLVKAWRHFAFAKGHMAVRNYEMTLSSLEKVPDLRPLLHVPVVATISLIFGWDIHSLITDIHTLRCQALSASRHTPGVLGYFSGKGASLDEESGVITAELSSISEMFGDEAKCDQRYHEAIAWYTEASSLSGFLSHIANRDVAMPQDERHMAPNSGNDDSTTQCWAELSRCSQCVAHLLSKRSEVEASKGSEDSCERALPYAAQAIKMDPSYYLGHHSKYMVLLQMKRYKEAFGSLQEMSSKSCGDPEIKDLIRNYSQTCKDIDRAIKGIFDASPFLLIHVGDGRLYSREERRHRFKNDESFYKLVTSVSTRSKPSNIEEVVKSYFLYVMFSHTWEGTEPLFADVSGKIIYDLPYEKLRRFCETVRDDPKGYRWAWNDTCCINKEDGKLLEMSLRSMYKWYGNSALTLVLLANPSKSDPPGSPYLEYNRWMFRAWTLQELLAPKVIRFYDYTWKLYRNDTSDNHKTSPEITKELARATGVKEDALSHFSLEKLPVRRRLCLASKREASVGVDIAYALIGILNSDIHVDYTCDADVALARLLRGCVNSHAAVTVFDWVGDSSGFNSCIPDDISVYSQDAYAPPAITDTELDRRTEVLRLALSEQELGHFRQQLTPRASSHFADRRLFLSCITFSITDIQHISSVQGIPTYTVSTTALGEFHLQTKEPFDVLRQGRRVLVYPWIPALIAEIRRLKGEGVMINPLWLIAYLELGFRALLFTERSHGQYRRIAADREIVVPAHRLTSLKGIGVETLEVWEGL